MKKYVFVAVGLLASIMLFSHEFWLQPVKFLLKINEATNIDVYVGEGFKGERADGTKYHIAMLKHFSEAGMNDYRSNASGKDSTIIRARFSTAGNHLIAFNNTNKSINLPANEFNAYLREEGLNDVLDERIRKNDTTSAGREVYQRCVKTLFQVGNSTDSTYKLNTGMRLELIPSANPYDIKQNDSIGFTVLFDNKLVENALVLAWNVIKGKTSVTKLRSDVNGNVRFPISRTGRWMISSVKMVPHINREEADWQSYWGSYTFGYY